MSEAKSATPTVPTARLTLGGKEREARFTIRSHMAIEDATNRPWFDVLAEARLGFSRAVVRLVWSTLQHAPEPPSLDQVADWLSELSAEDRKAVVSEVDRIVSASLPEKEKEGDDDGPLAEKADAA